MARARRTLSAPRIVFSALVAATLLGVSGCSYINPITTDVPYAASDGLQVEIGDQVTGSNLLVLTAEQGEPGVLLGAFTNRTNEPTTVTVQAQGGTDQPIVDVRLKPHETVLLGPPNAERRQVTGSASRMSATNPQIATVPARPGALVSITLSTPRSGEQQLQVPVLDGTLPAYEDLVPVAG